MSSFNDSIKPIAHVYEPIKQPEQKYELTKKSVTAGNVENEMVDSEKQTIAETSEPKAEESNQKSKIGKKAAKFLKKMSKSETGESEQDEKDKPSCSEPLNMKQLTEILNGSSEETERKVSTSQL